MDEHLEGSSSESKLRKAFYFKSIKSFIKFDPEFYNQNILQMYSNKEDYNQISISGITHIQ